MMDFEYQDEPEADAGSGPSYDGSAGNPHPRHPTETEEQQPQPRKSRYRECLKNHAVGIGGHAVDGCGEFMPAGEEGTIESLKCAACNCHRNFHRRDNNDNGGGGGRQHTHHHQHQLLLGYHGQFGYRSPTGYLQVPQPQHQRSAPLALPSSSGGGGGSRDDAEDYYSNPSSSGGQKRFRTKFSQEQKDRMLDLATRLDWKIQKQDEDLVQQMCTEIGVKRHVFKVWMHNNKQTLEILV